MNSVKHFAQSVLYSLTLATVITGGVSSRGFAQTLYSPIRVVPANEISDTLSENDIPTGQGGFARDYRVSLQSGDQVAIDLVSDSFDTIATLLAADGSTIAENDDGPDGTTNSLLFTRITKSGDYIVRVRSFGEATGGPFTLKITRLRPVDG